MIYVIGMPHPLWRHMLLCACLLALSSPVGGASAPPHPPWGAARPPAWQVAKILAVQNCNHVIEVCTHKLALPLVNIGGLDLAQVRCLDTSYWMNPILPI